MSDRLLGIRATRVHLALLALSVIILTFYSSLTIRTVSVTVFKPSLRDFEHLYDAHSLTLTCPCSQVAVPHDKMIITTPPIYHQVRCMTLKRRLTLFKLQNLPNL